MRPYTHPSMRPLVHLDPFLQVPLVKLDDAHYKLVDAMEAHIPPGSEPSLLGARTLVVKGPVKFPRGAWQPPQNHASPAMPKHGSAAKLRQPCKARNDAGAQAREALCASVNCAAARKALCACVHIVLLHARHFKCAYCAAACKTLRMCVLCCHMSAWRQIGVLLQWLMKPINPPRGLHLLPAKHWDLSNKDGPSMVLGYAAGWHACAAGRGYSSICTSAHVQSFLEALWVPILPAGLGSADTTLPP